MLILIDHKEAVVQRSTAFDYISENRFFTGADGYTLTLTFPLKGCPQNLDIFGHINRKDCDLARLTLPCELHDAHFHAEGVVSIVDISDVEVKTQFLEGRSVTNFHSRLDEVYINEIPMTSVAVELDLDDTARGALYYLRTYDEQQRGDYLGFVLYPWVNNTTGNIQNKLNVNSRGEYYFWTSSLDPHIGQPFLIEVLRQVFRHIDYEIDLAVFEQSWMANLIVCNALPHTWGLHAMQHALPHWTVAELLDEVELLLGGEFRIDTIRQRASFAFHAPTLAALPVVELRHVVDDYKVEVSDADRKAANEYFEHRNVAYAEAAHHMQRYYACPWLLAKTNTQTWADIAAMLAELRPYLVCDGPLTHIYYRSVHYCRAEDTRYILRCVRTDGTKHYLRLQPVNVFGPRTTAGNEEGQVDELRIVPACIDRTTRYTGDLIFLDCGSYDGDLPEGADNADQTFPVNLLAEGEQDATREYYDKLYVAFAHPVGQFVPKLPHPFIDRYDIDEDGTLREAPLALLRLAGPKAPAVRRTRYEVDQRRKFTFSFLADQIPDVHAVFLIHGKRYLAEKITTTVNEDGMCRLMKIVAYRII